MKSSLVRISLGKHLSLVAKTGKDLRIEHDGREIAVLSLTPPSTGTPPLDITVTEAQGAWSELLSIVSVRGARYVFTRKLSGENPQVVQVFLKRTKQSNRFNDAWNEHREAHRAEQEEMPADAVSQLIDGHNTVLDRLESIQAQLAETTELAKKTEQTSRIHFALTNRGGDIQNYPESGVAPLRNAFNSRSNPDDTEEFA